MTALAALLLIALVARPEPPVIERIVRVPIERAAEMPHPPLAERESPAIESEPAFSSQRRPTYGESYLHARDQALAFGIDSWMRSVPPTAISSGEPPASYRELRERLLQ